MVTKPTLKQLSIIMMVGLLVVGVTGAVAQVQTEDDSYDNPRTINYGEQVSGELTVRNENQDEDWFAFRGQEGQTVEITVTNVESSAIIEFQVLEPPEQGGIVNGSALSSGESVTFDRTLTNSGLFRIHLYPQTGRATASYTVEVTRTDQDTVTPAPTETTTETSTSTETTTETPTPTETATPTETPTPTPTPTETTETTETTTEEEPETEQPTASVNFDNQSSDGTTVTVDSVTMSEGGFIAIHNASLQDGNTLGSVVGVSEPLSAGTHENVEVTLFDVPGQNFSEDMALEENQTLIAMPHFDSNSNGVYDFITSNASEDGPYTANGSAVVDSASITVDDGADDADDQAEGGDDLGQNDEDDDGDGHVDEDGEDGNDVPSNDDDDGDGAIDEDDEPDDGDDGSDDFNGNAEDDDDGDGHVDEDDEEDGGNSDDEDNDGDGAVDEDDEPDSDD